MKHNQINERNTLINQPGLIVIIFTACFAFWFADFWKPINEATFNQHQEIFERYCYLPALFFNHQSFIWPNELVSQFSFHYENISHYNYGSAVLYFPFFIIAIFINYINGTGAVNGFSDIFLNSIHWSSIFYVLWGIIFLRKFLRYYFNEKVIAITLFSCLFGTTVFYYTFLRSELPESQLFFLFSAFIYYTKKWHDAPKSGTTLICAVLFALISLVRFFEIYALLFFLFWNITNFKTFKTKLQFFQSNYKQLLVLVFVFIILWLPQLLLDFHLSGYLFFTPNAKQAYDLADSRIDSVILSYQNGWLTYSPILVSAVLGLFFVDKKFPVSKITILVVLLLVIIIYGASWDWRNDVFFGARRLCAFSVWLIIPMAFLINRLFNSNRISILLVLLKLMFICFVFSCFCLNISQCYLSLVNKLQPKQMDEKKYWELFRVFKD